jgi:hypothetical protein
MHCYDPYYDRYYCRYGRMIWTPTPQEWRIMHEDNQSTVGHDAGDEDRDEQALF